MVPCLLTSTGRLNASRRLSASAELLVKHTIRIKTAWQMSVTVSSTPMIWGFVLPAGHQMLRPWTTPGTSIPDSLTLTFDFWRSWRTVQVEHPWSVWYVFCCGEETAAASLKAIRYSTHCHEITQFYIRAHPVFQLQVEWTIPAFAFPAAAAGTHLPTQERWKAEIQTHSLPTKACLYVNL